MADHVIPEVVDLTDGDSPRIAEVLTDACVIRVHTGLVTTHSRRPVVKVEVDPNVPGRAVTHAGGRWKVRTRQRGLARIEVVLTRADDEPETDHG